jgi:hypothetical protein
VGMISLHSIRCITSFLSESQICVRLIQGCPYAHPSIVHFEVSMVSAAFSGAKIYYWKALEPMSKARDVMSNITVPTTLEPRGETIWLLDPSCALELFLYQHDMRQVSLLVGTPFSAREISNK